MPHFWSLDLLEAIQQTTLSSSKTFFVPFAKRLEYFVILCKIDSLDMSGHVWTRLDTSGHVWTRLDMFVELYKILS